MSPAQIFGTHLPSVLRAGTAGTSHQVNRAGTGGAACGWSIQPAALSARPAASGVGNSRWPLCSAAKQREWTVQCGARRGETRAEGHRAGGREGQQCGSRLEDSPLKAMQASKTGPVASVLEDAKIFSEKPTPN